MALQRLFSKHITALMIFFQSVISFHQVAAQDFPGTVIAESASPLTRSYASPSIVILPDGNYLASHDFSSTETAVYRSEDRGLTWSFVSLVPDSHWAGLFVHQGKIYLMGTAKSFGNIVIHKSEDGGFSWSESPNSSTGLLLAGRFHTGPVPVVIHNGRIWRAYEFSPDPDNERDFHAFVLSAPVDADLLNASSWTRSDSLRFDESWLNAKRPNWFEGNMVVTPNGELVDFMRLETWQAVNGDFNIQGSAAGIPRYEVAAKISVSVDGKHVSFNNTSAEYVHFPGAESKFTIRYDPVSAKYWTITSKITTINPGWETFNLPGHQRNVLTLFSSPDLVNWTECYKIIRWNEGYVVKTWDVFGFQYADWQFDGNDIVAVSRTSWYGARYHDANLITFHRVENFRSKVPADSPADLYPLTVAPSILSWQFGSPQASGSEVSLNSTFTDPNLNISSLSRGSGLTNTASLQRSFNSTAPVPANSKENAVSGNQYLQFVVQAKVGYNVSLSTLDVKLRRNSAGATKYKWMYSTDGSSFNEIGDYDIAFTDNNTDGVVQSTIHLVGLKDLQQVPASQKVYFRLYFWGASSASGGFAIGRYGSGVTTSSLSIGGQVNAEEPQSSILTAWQLSGLSGTTTGSVSSTTNHSGMEQAELSRGPGLIPTGFNYAYNSTLSSYGVNNSKSYALSNGDYYSFSLQAQNGYKCSLSSLDVKLRRNTAGPTLFSWFYSIDGQNFTEITKGVNVLNGATEGEVQQTLDLSGLSELQNVLSDKVITFRVYGWNAGAATGGFAIGRYPAENTTNSLEIRGTSILQTVLPLIVGSFKGKKGANYIKLDWSTIPGNNPANFQILRFGDNVPKEIIADLPSKKGTEIVTFTYNDLYPLAGSNYYQLNQSNENGQIMKSELIQVNNVLDLTDIDILSNIQNTNTAVNIRSSIDAPAALEIFDLSGKCLFSSKMKVVRGLNSYQIPFNYNQGLYVARLNLNNRLISKKFLRQ